MVFDPTRATHAAKNHPVTRAAPTPQPLTPPLAEPAPWTPPDPIPSRLETPRVLIRTFDTADAAAVWMSIEESRESLLPWLPWARSDNRSIAEAHCTIERFRRDLGRAAFDAGRLNLVLGVFDRTSGRLLGGTGFHSFRPHAGQAEIGYWVRATERRRGLCTHTTAAMISWAFTPPDRGGWGLRRIEIVCAAGNPGSSGVCQRLALREEGRSHADRWISGRGWDDTIRYGVVATEWDVEAMARRSR